MWFKIFNLYNKGVRKVWKDADDGVVIMSFQASIVFSVVLVVMALMSSIRIQYISAGGARMWKNAITGTSYIKCYECDGDVKVSDSALVKLEDGVQRQMFVIREYNGLLSVFFSDILEDVK